MADVKPFRALRYDEANAGELETLVAPPYDVITPPERASEYLARSPYNVVHLTLPDSEADAAEPSRSGSVTACSFATTSRRTGCSHRSTSGPDGVRRTRNGIVASLRAEPYENGVVLPHERTHRGPKEGRLRLLRAVGAQLEPIFSSTTARPSSSRRVRPTSRWRRPGSGVSPTRRTSRPRRS